MKKILFIGNTPYQILLSTWIKYHYYPEDLADIIVHDRLKGFERIKSNIESLDVFSNVIVMPNHYKKTKFGKVMRIFKEYRFSTVEFRRRKYDVMYFANFDFSAQRIYNTLKKNNNNLELNTFEDGILSYSPKLEYFYKMLDKPTIHNISHNNAFIKYHVFGNVTNYCVFDPELMEWKPEVNAVKALDKIDINDKRFVGIVNQIFDYDNNEDCYDTPYIFMEESYYQDFGFNEDADLIRQLAEAVGKDKLMIKIHPRNQKNRFKELGFKTNTNTAIPWEVLAMNMDLSAVSVISIGSASLVNPTRMFACKAKNYSLINCISTIPPLLQGDYGNTINRVYDFYGVKNVNNISEIIQGESK